MVYSSVVPKCFYDTVRGGDNVTMQQYLKMREFSDTSEPTDQTSAATSRLLPQCACVYNQSPDITVNDNIKYISKLNVERVRDSQSKNTEMPDSQSTVTVLNPVHQHHNETVIFRFWLVNSIKNYCNDGHDS